MRDPGSVAILAAVAVVAAAVLARPAALALVHATRLLARLPRRAADRVGRASVRGAAWGLLGSGAVLVTGTSAVGAAPAPVALPTTGPAAAARLPAGPLTPEVYVVAPGDCLWTIARDHLPRGASDGDVAAAWPRWWRDNRVVIGPDPGLIHPGTRLVVPLRFRSTGTSTTAAEAAASFDPDRR